MLKKSIEVPCTGIIPIEGFSSFLDREMGEPRRNIKLFSENLCNKLGVNFLSLVNSGSSANLVVSIYLKEKTTIQRPKVLLGGFAFPTTVSAFKLLGFDVELIDTPNSKGLDTFSMDPALIPEMIDDNTVAICVSHFLGYPAQIKKISDICKKHHLFLIQDACETMDLSFSGRSIYDFGDIITHSFYHPHHLSSYGGGGVISKNKEMYKDIESIIHWGRSCFCHQNSQECEVPKGINHNFTYKRLGINVEMSELNACFGRFMLSSWKKQEELRYKNYNYFLAAFGPLIEAGKVITYPNHKNSIIEQNVSPFVFPITFISNESQNKFMKSMKKKKIEVRSIMGGLISNQSGFNFLKKFNLENCASLSKRTVILGIHQFLTDDQRTIVIDAIKSLKL